MDQDIDDNEIVEEKEEEVEMRNENKKNLKTIFIILSFIILTFLTYKFMINGTFFGYIIIKEDEWAMLKLRHELLINELVTIKTNIDKLRDTNMKINEKLEISNNLSNSLKNDRKEEVDNVVNDIIDIIKAGKELKIEEQNIKNFIEKRFQSNILINSDFWKKGEYWNLVFSNESKLDFNPKNVERWIKEMKKHI